MRYIEGDQLEEAKLALRAGVPLGTISRRLNVEVDDLRIALNIPALKPVPPQDVDADLWASDRLDGVL